MHCITHVYTCCWPQIGIIHRQRTKYHTSLASLACNSPTHGLVPCQSEHELPERQHERRTSVAAQNLHQFARPPRNAALGPSGRPPIDSVAGRASRGGGRAGIWRVRLVRLVRGWLK